MKLIATIVLYNPDEVVFKNIQTYISFVDKLIVVDNSVSQNKELITKIESNFDNVIYVNNHTNRGIAIALNIACDRAIKDGYDWILTMDQDSKFVNFEEYKKCFFEIIEMQKNIGIVTLNHTHDLKHINIDVLNCRYKEQEIVITSGNFVNLTFFNQVGRFDDDLFIDMVDYDFSHKMILSGYRIIQFTNHYLIHQLGEVFERKNLFTRKVRKKIEHNPQRVYYITRNRLFISRRYSKQLPKEYNAFKTFNTLFIHEVTKILLYEDQKLKKLYAKFLGLFHFLINKRGKYII